MTNGQIKIPAWAITIKKADNKKKIHCLYNKNLFWFFDSFVTPLNKNLA